MIFDELKGKPNGLFYAINGYIFGNLPGLVMKQGERVRWYLLGMGNEIDLHTPHWHGKVVQYGNRHTDVIELMPGSMAVADMKADNPGTWLFHCHVAEHMESGMMARYSIYQPRHCDSPIQFVSGSFWDDSKKFHLTIRNPGQKPVKQVVVGFDHLMTSQHRRRPFEPYWTFSADIQPGQEQSFEVPGYKRELENTVFGWVLFPRTVAYQDGTIWQPKDENQCFQVYWRDKDRPQPDVLPPLQVELNED